MKPHYQEPSATVYQGHALDVLKELLDESVDCCVCSPPYWGLRTYKTEPIIWGDNHCEHDFSVTASPRRQRRESDIVDMTSKQATVGGSSYDASGGNFCLKCGAWRGELGLEPTIELYIDHLLQIFDEVKRVLKKTGTLWVNIGDSYASGKGTCFNPGGGKGSFSGHGDRKDAGAYPLDRGNISMLRAEGLTPKSLCLIPERFALGMVERGWILRNNIIWYKPNPMPESVKDRFTGTYEYVYFFTKAQRYFFEQQFERGIMEYGDSSGSPQQDTRIGHGIGCGNSGINEAKKKLANELATIGYTTRNKRDVWEINTQPYPEAHFAVFPEKLVETPILSGCPSAICKKCGKAREKIYSFDYEEQRVSQSEKYGHTLDEYQTKPTFGRGIKNMSDKGYTDCGCNAGFEPGVVLDPFAGSGTTGLVAKKLGRKYIGIELNPKYCKMHVKRLQGVPLAMELA